MIDIILFYISEYFVYVTVMAAISALVIFIIKRYEIIDDIRPLVGVVVAAYMILFTGIGGMIKPYFTDHSQYAIEGYGSVYHGTGSFINRSDVMTNAHVVEACLDKPNARIEVRAKSGIYEGKIIAVLKRGEGDIAFIRTNAYEKKFILLSHERPKIGDIVLFPNYTSNPIIFDKVKGKIITLGSRQAGLEFLAPKGRQGNSGSPVYSQQGYVVGILHSGSYTDAVAVATDAITILSFAMKNNIEMFYSKNQEKDLTKEAGFFDDFAVSVICAPRKK